jgi:uncharacterized protein (DUF4213/DUF364 family)
MTAIIDALLNSLEGDAPIRRVLVGAHDMAVCGRRCGLASTLADCHDDDRRTARDVFWLRQTSTRALAGLARSPRPLEASLGMAAINSLLPLPREASRSVNAFDLLARYGAGKRVAVVGHFPFVDRLRPLVADLSVLEQRPRPGDEPANRAPEVIPRADVVAITSTALVNHTLEPLLGYCRSDAFVVMLGPSTPMWPGMFRFGVNALAGADVVDEGAALDAIARGSPFQDVPGVARVVVVGAAANQESWRGSEGDTRSGTDFVRPRASGTSPLRYAETPAQGRSRR